ncbi:cytochrome P450 [Nocardioides sp. CFH 31398]|uniref:cytochrome P450 n=1 Tax=Nocardioides sp. CFH 31398 TaxID=2919579 RepID=UPI001F055AC5|nr:cytochrome P450 [Nocardioides sp. CFH 31398]MCH1868818.1 cytochrome P450 [Nocardioides sp. CFH 31398]
MSDLATLLLTHGFRAIETDRDRRGATATYPSRLLGSRAVVVGTEEGARTFYDPAATRRADAVPAALGWLLFGRGAVHTLDHTEHAERKDLLRAQMGVEGVTRCAAEAGRLLGEILDEAGEREVDLHDALVVAYGVAALRWAGFSLAPHVEVDLARTYARVVDGFGLRGSAYARAWVARARTDAWARLTLRAIRHGELVVAPGTPAHAIAASDLDERTAAVELGNLVRPTIATSWLGCFAVLDAHRWTDGETWLERSAARRRSFLHEVRRTAPFVPALAAVARRPLEVDGVAVAEGERLLLDVPGINHDPATYPAPDRFEPERFVGTEPPPYGFVPQGGGRVRGHRCPGEDLVTVLLDATLDEICARGVVPVGSWDVDLRRIPTLPGGTPYARATLLSSTADVRVLPRREAATF